MNQKDYKEIAGILKQPFLTIENKPYIRNTANVIAERLADYFERNQCMDNTCDCHVLGKNIDCCIVCSPHKDDKFNQQQFLKDCGVK